MPKIAKIYDVFISHAATDAGLALDLANACRANGLAAITFAELLPEKNLSNALREAIVECKAMLIILSRPELTPAMSFELGAAQVWDKPIFGVVSDPTMTNFSPALSNIRIYTAGAIEDVIRAIKLSSKELSDDDRSILGKLYAKIGLSPDELAVEPESLRKVVQRFRANTGKSVSGERLLSELLRMRKQGKLSPLSAKTTRV
jgi:hypothetical protein